MNTIPMYHEFNEGHHFVIVNSKTRKYLTFSKSMKEWMWDDGIDTARGFVTKDVALAFLNSHTAFKEEARIIRVDVKKVYCISIKI